MVGIGFYVGRGAYTDNKLLVIALFWPDSATHIIYSTLSISEAVEVISIAIHYTVYMFYTRRS